MVIAALEKAFAVAVPQILNSDQGCQFTSKEYVNYVQNRKIRISMDGKGRWADNIMIERWFRSLKYEEVYLTSYQNIREARTAIGKYIHDYNFKRLHSSLEYNPPRILLLSSNAAPLCIMIGHISMDTSTKQAARYIIKQVQTKGVALVINNYSIQKERVRFLVHRKIAEPELAKLQQVLISLWV